MDVAGWIAYNLSKWERVAGTLPGLSLSQSGPDETTFILGFSKGDFEQRVIIGRMARVTTRPYLGPKGTAVAAGYVDEEIIDGGENVSFEEVQRMVACWRDGKQYEPRPVRR